MEENGDQFHMTGPINQTADGVIRNVRGDGDEIFPGTSNHVVRHVVAHVYYYYYYFFLLLLL